MKTIFSFFALVALAVSAIASAGPGPWANATYYPGNLDGKYQAAVYGNNIAGVLGFALNNASPTVSTNSEANLTNSITQNTIIVDPFQNYFTIFVEGRTYTGISTANVNYDNSSVTGTLIGSQPNFTFLTNFANINIRSQLITNVTITNIGGLAVTNIVIETIFLTNSIPSLDPAGLINRGLNGGFQAHIDGNGGVFTFNGNGELSTPAQFQTVNFTTNAIGEVVGAQVVTDTVPFQLNGIRVSFTTTP